MSIPRGVVVVLPLTDRADAIAGAIMIIDTKPSTKLKNNFFILSIVTVTCSLSLFFRGFTTSAMRATKNNTDPNEISKVIPIAIIR